MKRGGNAARQTSTGRTAGLRTMALEEMRNTVKKIEGKQGWIDRETRGSGPKSSQKDWRKNRREATFDKDAKRPRLEFIQEREEMDKNEIGILSSENMQDVKVIGSKNSNIRKTVALTRLSEGSGTRRWNGSRNGEQVANERTQVTKVQRRKMQEAALEEYHRVPYMTP